MGAIGAHLAGYEKVKNVLKIACADGQLVEEAVGDKPCYWHPNRKKYANSTSLQWIVYTPLGTRVVYVNSKFYLADSLHGWIMTS